MSEYNQKQRLKTQIFEKTGIKVGDEDPILAVYSHINQTDDKLKEIEKNLKQTYVLLTTLASLLKYVMLATIILCLGMCSIIFSLVI